MRLMEWWRAACRDGEPVRWFEAAGIAVIVVGFMVAAVLNGIPIPSGCHWCEQGVETWWICVIKGCW